MARLTRTLLPARRKKRRPPRKTRKKPRPPQRLRAPRSNRAGSDAKTRFGGFSVFRLTGRAVATTAGRMDFKDVARLHLRLANVAEFFDAPIHSQGAIDADLPRLAARHAESAVLAAIR